MKISATKDDVEISVSACVLRKTASIVAFTLGSTLAIGMAVATDSSTYAAETSSQQGVTDKRLMVSNGGFKAERELGAARVAIFRGNTDAARTLIKDAQDDLKAVAQQALKDFPDGAPTADGKGTGNPDVIPIDGEMAVADDMVLTPDKASKIKEANVHADTAATLLDQGKYYEANLALKAAQDLLRADTAAFGDTAAQAAEITGLPAAGSVSAAPAEK